MNNEHFGGCPYQAEDGFNDRNRFQKGHCYFIWCKREGKTPEYSMSQSTDCDTDVNAG